MVIIELYFQQNYDYIQQKSVPYAMFSASSQLSRDGAVVESNVVFQHTGHYLNFKNFGKNLNLRMSAFYHCF